MAGGRDLRDALPALLQTVVEELGWERGRLWLAGQDGEPALEAESPRGSAAARPSGRLAAATRSGCSSSTAGRTSTPGRSLEAFAATLGAQVGEFIVRRRAEEQRLHEALHDPLTGLPNRVLFFDRLDHAIRRQQREHAPLAVLFLDFDGFKAVNDRFGHAGGDEVLQRAAALRRLGAAGRGHGGALRRRRARRALRAHAPARRRRAGSPTGSSTRCARRSRSTARSVTLSASIGICLAPVEGAHARGAAEHRRPRDVPRQGRGPGRCVIAEA